MIEYLRDFPTQWKTILNRFRKSSILNLAEDTPTVASSNDFPCYVCGLAFATFQALKSHERHRHNYSNPFRIKISGTTCLKCGTQFHLRSRLLKHLSRVAASCGQHYLDNVCDMSKEEAEVQWTADRVASGSAGEKALFKPCILIQSV